MGKRGVQNLITELSRAPFVKFSSLGLLHENTFI